LKDEALTSSGDPSTADIVLRALLCDRTIKKDRRNLIKLVRYFRKVQKVLGTYVVKLRFSNVLIEDDLGWDDDEDWVDKETRKKYGLEKVGIVDPITGRMHPGYSPLPNTGRLSSSKPLNAQNFPIGMRGMVCAAEGHVLVGADSNQLEVRIAAAWWQIERYLQAFREKKDPHSMTAFMIFGDAFCKAAGIDPLAFNQPGVLVGTVYKNGKFSLKEGEAYDLRHLAKTVHFASQYMAGPPRAHKIITATEVPAKDENGKPRDDGTTDLPYARLGLKEVRQMRESWLKGVPEYERGWQRDIETWKRQGYLREAVTGRRRDFLDGTGDDGENPNEIVNFPIQCFRGDTRVLTGAGWQQIDGLVGQSFLAWTGHRWAPATAIAKGTAPLYRITSRSGLSVVCDASHGLKVQGLEGYEWRAVGGIGLEPLHPGDIFALNLAAPIEFPQCNWLSEEAAWVIGFWLGNGSADKRAGRTNISWVVGHREGGRRDINYISSRLVRFCRSMGWHVNVEEQPASLTRVTASALNGSPRDWMEAVGLSPYEAAHTKRVPQSVMSASLPSRRSFMRGFLDADGCFSDTHGARVVVTLCQHELLRDLILVAQTVGVPSSGIFGPYEADKVGHIAWRTMFSADRCWSELTWGGPGKLRTNRQAGTPAWELVRAFADGLEPTSRSDVVIKSRIKKHIQSGSLNRLNVSPYVLQRMGARNLYDHDSVELIEALPDVAPVFTLSVDDELHQYVGEGFISKNSAAAGLMNLAMLQLHEQIPRHKWGPGTGIIGQVHDWIGVECPESEAEGVAKMLEEAMTMTHPRLPGVEFSADPSTGHRWSDV